MPRKVIVYAAFAILLFSIPGAAQTSQATQSAQSKSRDVSPSKDTSQEARVERYLRHLYAWGPEYTVKTGPTKQSPIPDLLEVPVTVSMKGQSDTAVVYVTKTGNFLFRGELTDMSVDPFADTLSKLHVGRSPTMGPENAKITLYEFADFECPSCRQLDLILREFMPAHPEVRLVFKHYPLTEIHPWAMTAAIAAQCAYHQSPAAFWKMHDAIFDAQEVISASNVWDKMQDLANQAGLDQETYKACRINPETANEIKAITEEGNQLKITATPTTFINGRRLIGPDKSLLNQYMEY